MRAGMELWQMQPAPPHSQDSSDAGGSLLSNGTDLALGVELGSFDGSLDLGDMSGGLGRRPPFRHQRPPCRCLGLGAGLH
jgi:hypothetical protein